MLLSVLLALTVIMLTARLVGAVFARLNQPAVIGEVVGGLMLGPSLLGRFFPEIQAFILPPDAAPVLGVISQLGVILYMFLVGLELDLGLLRTTVSKTIAISPPRQFAMLVLMALVTTMMTSPILTRLTRPGIQTDAA